MNKKHYLNEAITETESKIWEFLVNTGSCYKEIAAQFNISPKTVSVHVSNLHKKLGTHSLIKLAILGWKTNLRINSVSPKLLALIAIKEQLIELNNKIDNFIEIEKKNEQSNTRE